MTNTGSVTGFCLPRPLSNRAFWPARFTVGCGQPAFFFLLFCFGSAEIASGWRESSLARGTTTRTNRKRPERSGSVGDGAQLEIWKGRQQTEGSEETQRACGEASSAWQGRFGSGGALGVNNHDVAGLLTRF